MTSTNFMRPVLVLAATMAAACKPGGAGLFSKSPGDVVKAAYLAANEGRYSETEKYLSSAALKLVQSDLGALAGGMKGIWDKETRNGTIESIETVAEEIRGEGASVHIRIHFKDGSSKEDDEPLVKEGGQWKLTTGGAEKPKAGAASNKPPAKDDRAAVKRTMQDMRALATAIEAYAVDHNQYPPAACPPGALTGVSSPLTAASFSNLRPTYMQEVPWVDGWKRPFRYSLAMPDRNAYRIESLGRDGKAAPLVCGTTTSFDADIVYSNGTFIQWPEF